MRKYWCPPRIDRAAQFDHALEKMNKGDLVEFHIHGTDTECPAVKDYNENPEDTNGISLESWMTICNPRDSNHCWRSSAS